MIDFLLCTRHFWYIMTFTTQGSFPGGLVVKTLGSTAGGSGFNPSTENWDPTSRAVARKKTQK